MASYGNVSALGRQAGRKVTGAVKGVGTALAQQYASATAGISRLANSARDEEIKAIESQIEGKLFGDVESTADGFLNALKDSSGRPNNVSKAIQQAYNLMFEKLGREKETIAETTKAYWLATLMMSNAPEYLTAPLAKEDVEQGITTLNSGQNTGFAPPNYSSMQVAPAPSAMLRGTSARPATYHYQPTSGYGAVSSVPFTSVPGNKKTFPRPGLFGGKKTRKGRKHRKHTRKAQRKGRKGTRK